MNHIELGKEGERLAANHLIKKGHIIVELNYRWKKLELDIISIQNKVLVVSEVKTRFSSYFGEPYKAVTRAKQMQIIRATNKFIESSNMDYDVRFDVISIVKSKIALKIEHIENAFYPTL